MKERVVKLINKADAQKAVNDAAFVLDEIKAYLRAADLLE